MFWWVGAAAILARDYPTLLSSSSLDKWKPFSDRTIGCNLQQTCTKNERKPNGLAGVLSVLVFHQCFHCLSRFHSSIGTDRFQLDFPPLHPVVSPTKK
ncbi:hypothetical protein BLOT_014807 [Blomia tropicalis]|nr:hypothetical protein BLOT_014807 [Blomia tropicalis]